MKKEKLVNLYKKYSFLSEENPLYIKNSKKFVPGHGNIDSKVMFIGEAPGEEEERTGIPFAGRSGKLLREYLLKYNFSSKNIFVTNVIKFRPPNNRKPTTTEVVKNTPFLHEEINIINPIIVVAVGATAASFLLEKSVIQITKIHGKIYQKSGYLIFPILHPAYILRNYTLLDLFENDIKNLELLYWHHAN